MTKREQYIAQFQTAYLQVMSPPRLNLEAQLIAKYPNKMRATKKTRLRAAAPYRCNRVSYRVW